MKFSIRYADKIVGTLVVLGLAILVFVIFMLGKNQRWFIRDHQYKTYFHSASGLSANMAVQYRGFTIGYIKRIRLSDDDNVEVVFTIFEEHNHRVKEGSVVEFTSSPIPGLGNAFLFLPGRGAQQLPEGSIIPEINSPMARQLIARGLTERLESGDNVANLLNNVNALLEIVNVSLGGSEVNDEPALRQIVLNIEQAAAGINNVVQEINSTLLPTLANIETITDSLASPSSAVMSVLDSEGPVYTSISDALVSLSSVMNSLDKTVEFIPTQLPQIAIVLSDLQSALREAEKLIIALNNNPLLRGGVPDALEASPGAGTIRNLDF